MTEVFFFFLMNVFRNHINRYLINMIFEMNDFDPIKDSNRQTKMVLFSTREDLFDLFPSIKDLDLE